MFWAASSLPFLSMRVQPKTNAADSRTRIARHYNGLVSAIRECLTQTAELTPSEQRALRQMTRDARLQLEKLETAVKETQ